MALHVIGWYGFFDYRYRQRALNRIFSTQAYLKAYFVMGISYYQQAYDKLSKIVFEWQDNDRASLLALLILLEAVLAWAWCLMVWINSQYLISYIQLNQTLFYIFWAVSTLAIGFYGTMVQFFQKITALDKLNFWLYVISILYIGYLMLTIVMMNANGFIIGVSLVGGGMIAMLLIDKRMAWYAFITCTIASIILILLPYYDVNLSSLRLPDNLNHQTMHDAFNIINQDVANQKIVSQKFDSILPSDEQQLEQVMRTWFWQLTYLYFSLPKAIISVFLFRTLLTIIEHNRREIQYNADYDALTGIKNRRYILNWFHQTLFSGAALQAEPQDYSLILLDLDRFKALNDGYGHQLGDKVLKEVADLLNAALVRRYVASRYGGEEFLLVLPKTDHAQALTIAEALRKEIETHTIHTGVGHKINISASFGVLTIYKAEVALLQKQYQASLGSHNRKTFRSSQGSIKLIQKLIDLADVALYQAKNNGRNQVVSANVLIDENKIAKPSFLLT